MDTNLGSALANPVNSVEQGYQDTNSKIMAAQNLHDNNMLKVLEFAGNGDVQLTLDLPQILHVGHN